MAFRKRALSRLRAFRGEDAPLQTHRSAEAPPPATEGESPGRFSSLAKRAAAGELGEALYADDASTDRAAYLARMKANGREVELAGEGLNKNSDGGVFWGPIDNDSSQSKATGKVLSIDQWECITCGTCEENTKVVFHVPDEEKARVLQQDGPMDLIQDAIDACPVTCISWIHPDSLDENHSHGGFEIEQK